MRPLLFLLFVFCVSPVLGNSDSLHAVQLAALAEKYVSDQPDSAVFYLKKSLETWRQQDDLTQWIKTCKRLAVTFDEQGQAEQSLKIYSFADQPNLPRPPASSDEWDALAWHYVNWGYTLKYSLSRFLDAKDIYEKAKDLFENKLPGNEPIMVADFVYRELGNIYTRLGDYEAAQVLFEKMKTTGLQAKNYPLAAEACIEQGIVFYWDNQFEAAVKSYEEGLRLPELNILSESSLNLNLAISCTALGDDACALKALNKTLPLLEKIVRDTLHERGKTWLASAYVAFAEIQARQGKFEPAKAHHLKSLALLREIYPDTLRREIGKAYFNLGNLHLQFSMPDQALAYFHKMLLCVLPGFKTKDVMANPPAQTFYAENTILDALAGKATAFETLFRQKSERVFLEKSLECHELLFAAEQAYRRVHHYESSRLNTIEESSQRAESAIQTAWQAHRTWDEATWLEAAYRFSEKSKSTLLYEALRHSDASNMANLPQQLLEKEHDLNDVLTDLEKTLFLEKQKGAVAKTGELESRIFNLNKDLADLRHEIEQDYPEFFRLKYKQDAVSVKETQRLLRPDQALVEYFVGDSAIFIFLVKKDAFTAERLPKNFPLERWVAEFRQGIEAFQFSSSNRDSLCLAYVDLAQKLYQKLLQPLEKQGLPKNLIIVPGGVLGFLPFDALLTEAPAQPYQFRSFPYVVRRHAISYNYSSTLFKELSEGKRRQAAGGFAAFAPEFLAGNSSGFGALQFNVASAEAVRELVGGQIFPGAAATGQAFLANAEKFRLLYLATHAKANTDEGDFSFIVLAGADSGFDTLFVKDIYNLPLAADLVFLGACETGSGKMHNGEGIISLARSFLYAGARSIVTTLWSINDESNKELTLSFFRYLSGGERKDVALQLAKLEQLENSPHDLYAHPVFWAAYVPIGNMEPVEKTFAWWMVAAGIGVVGFAFFAWRRKFELGFVGFSRILRMRASAS